MSYIIVQWPESQELMEEEDFQDNAFLINDEKGLEKFGSSAFFVDEKWYELYYRYKDEVVEIKEPISLSQEEILEIIDSLKIEPNPYTRGEMCKFKVRENYYYASRCLTFDHGMQCMIFSTDEKGNVIDWTDLYASRELSIIESIKDFLRSL